MGSRISDLRHRGEPLDANRRYKVAGWASVQERPAGEPIWEVVATYLRDRRVIPQQRLNAPRLEGVAGNAGLAA
jgi:sulfur-oxidizing protein SoxB